MSVISFIDHRTKTLRNKLSRRTSVLKDAQILYDLIKSDKNAFNQKLNEFLAKYCDDETLSISKIRPVFDGTDIQDIPTEALPLYVVKDLISSHRLCIKSSTHTNWSRFVKYYRNAIYV